jgi:hypothetical protein
MILIIHGNDIESSRNFYFEEKNKLSNPIIINGDGILFDSLFQAAENTNFFDDKKDILIENFFIKNKATSAEFKRIIEYINSNDKLSITFWESDEVSKTSLSLIKKATLKNFSLPQNLFAFLDGFKPGNSKELLSGFAENLKKSEAELIFFMIVRQFRIMLSLIRSETPIDEVKRMAPWQLSKLERQAKLFGEDKLKEIYNKLLEIDLNSKTGKNSTSLKKSIDFFLSGL